MAIRAWSLACLAAFANAHVPTYTESASRCHTPPHHHGTSQVVYVRGSGGLEVHCSAKECPFDYANGERLDIDVVFRDEVDQSTYALYIGCVGCMPEDPIDIDAVQLHGYQPGVLEPFTQTSYRSVFADAEKTFNSSRLDPSACAENHFGIRLRQFANASRDIVWGAVIGKGEDFTTAEMLSFPVYVLRNHGETWNELPWTVWVIAVAVVLLIVANRKVLERYGGLAWALPSLLDEGMHDPRMHPRAWLLQLSACGFLVAGLEMFVHLVYAQTTSQLDVAFLMGLAIVLLNGVALALVYTIWCVSLCPTTTGRCRCRCLASPYWWPLELLSALAFFFALGAGFYAGPAFLAIDAFVRMGEMPTWRRNAVDARKVAAAAATLSASADANTSLPLLRM